MRVLAVGNSFTITQATRPHMLRNFSSHAQSLDALIETGWWSARTVVEDGHQYWRSFFRFGGNYEAIPVYSPIYQDAVLSDSYKETLIAQFVQVRRWAYGVSDIPYIANLGFRRKTGLYRSRFLYQSSSGYLIRTLVGRRYHFFCCWRLCVPL